MISNLTCLGQTHALDLLPQLTYEEARLVDSHGDKEDDAALHKSAVKGGEFGQHHRHRHVQDIDVEGAVLAEPIVVEITAGLFQPEEKFQKHHRRDDARDIHLHHRQPRLNDLEEEGGHAYDQIDVFVPRPLVEVHLGQEIT